MTLKIIWGTFLLRSILHARINQALYFFPKIVLAIEIKTKVDSLLSLNYPFVYVE